MTYYMPMNPLNSQNIYYNYNQNLNKDIYQSFLPTDYENPEKLEQVNFLLFIKLDIKKQGIYLQ